MSVTIVKCVNDREYRTHLLRIQATIVERGSHPGLVAVLSAMEPCSSYKPWHDKGSGKAFSRSDDGKCLHYCVPQMHRKRDQYGLIRCA